MFINKYSNIFYNKNLKLKYVQSWYKYIIIRYSHKTRRRCFRYSVQNPEKGYQKILRNEKNKDAKSNPKGKINGFE